MSAEEFLSILEQADKALLSLCYPHVNLRTMTFFSEQKQIASSLLWRIRENANSIRTVISRKQNS